MRSLLFITSAAVGMTLPVLIYTSFGSSLILTAGLLTMLALFCALCLMIERAQMIEPDKDDFRD